MIAGFAAAFISAEAPPRILAPRPGQCIFPHAFIYRPSRPRPINEAAVITACSSCQPADHTGRRGNIERADVECFSKALATQAN